jgi:putative tricarboxylic transport membrane protein
MKERVVALGILAFALVYLAGAVSLKVGTLAQPGAGQFPAAIAITLLAVAAYHAWRTFHASPGEDGSHSWSKLAPAGIAAALVVYPVLLRTLSFLLATFIILFALFRLLGFRRYSTSALSAAVTTVLSFVVFAGLLGVVLPSGAMELSILNVIGMGG